MYNKSVYYGSLPLTLMQTSNDPVTSYNSYRPLLLLNVDIKILATVLVSCIERILPNLLSEEQTECIKGRHYYTCTLNIIYSNHSVSPETVISADAQIAFKYHSTVSIEHSMLKWHSTVWNGGMVCGT